MLIGPVMCLVVTALVVGISAWGRANWPDAAASACVKVACATIALPLACLAFEPDWFGRVLAFGFFFAMVTLFASLLLSSMGAARRREQATRGEIGLSPAERE